MSETIFKNYVKDLKSSLSFLDYEIIDRVCNTFIERIESKSNIFLIGNGGSSATPSHSAGDFSKEIGAKVLCLTDNTSALTAWANDTDYSNVFLGQLDTFMDKNDLVVGYSGSGNSPNVINAMRHSKSKGVFTIGITGNYNGKGAGKIEMFSDILVFFETESMERIEDLQLIFNHIIKDIIKYRLKI